MRSEGLYSDADCKNVLQYSTFLDGSEGNLGYGFSEVSLCISVLSHGSEGRPEEMIFLIAL